MSGLQDAFNPNIKQQNQISETELKSYLINSTDFYYLKSSKNILISFRECLSFDGFYVRNKRVTDNVHGWNPDFPSPLGNPHPSGMWADSSASFTSHEFIHVPGKWDLVPHITCTDICGSLVVGRATDMSLDLCSFHYEMCRNSRAEMPIHPSLITAIPSMALLSFCT